MDTDISTKIAHFFSGYTLRHYPKGQILLLSGDTATHVYYLVIGRVKLYDVTYRGDEVILNVFKPPAFFPMSLALNNTRNEFIYEAETDIEIRQAPADTVVAFLQENPEVAMDLLRRVYAGVDGMLGRMAHLMASSAKARLMYEILIACKRFGTTTPSGAVTLAINEADLAARAGLSRETVSREITKMSKEKLVTLRSGKLTLRDLTTFEAKLAGLA